MSGFVLNNTLNKRIFILNKSEIEENLNPHFFISSDAEYLKVLNSLKTTSLMSICSKIMSGPFGSTLKSEHYGKGEVPFIRIKNIKNGVIDENELVYISEEDNERIKNSELNSGDIVLSKIGTIGETAIIPEHFAKCNISENNIGIKVRDVSSSLFIQIMLGTGFSKAQMNKKLSGNVQNFLNVDTIKNLKIPLLDQSIQNKIVTDYNASMNKISQIKTKVFNMLESIDEYLLGELGIALPDKDNSLKNRIFTTSLSKLSGGRYDPLFYSENIQYLYSSRFSYKKLHEITNNFKSGFGVGRNEQVNENEGILQIRPTNLDRNGDLIFEKNVYVPESYLGKKDFIKENNVIFNNTNSQELVGKTYIFQENDIIAIYSNHITVFESFNQTSNPYYLKEILNMLQRHHYFYSVCTNWNNQSGVGVVLLKQTLIPIPTIEKQNEIAEHICQIREQAKQLQTVAVEELEKSKQIVDEIILAYA